MQSTELTTGARFAALNSTAPFTSGVRCRKQLRAMPSNSSLIDSFEGEAMTA